MGQAVVGFAFFEPGEQGRIATIGAGSEPAVESVFLSFGFAEVSAKPADNSFVVTQVVDGGRKA